jgi:hypothetical protein
MKLRSLLLVSCMLVVPALAMFSHWIPTEFRAATRRGFAVATSGVLGTPAEAGTVPTPPTPPTPPTTPPTGGAPAASPSLLPIAAQPADAVAEPSTPPMVAQLADRTRQVRDQQARDQQAIEAQLKAAGAVSFDCQPLPGPEGLYSSSCRVPVDATGQLQRVFQATGHDPGSASTALLEQVMGWRQRAVTQSPPAATEGMGDTGSLPADRFR